MTQSIIAAINGGMAYEKYCYFFGSAHYRRYNWNNDILDDGGSLPLFAFHLPPEFHSNLDTAMNGGGSFAPYAYFFKGDQYVRYEWASNRVDYGPTSIGQAWNLTGNFTADLDAALCGVGAYANKAYFFKGNKYARYDWTSGQIDFVTGLDAWNLPADFLEGIDAAVNGWGPYTGKAYFFNDDQFLRYDWNSGTVDAGFPKSVALGWSALLGLAAVPRRRMVLYVTIDSVDDHQPNGKPGRHANSFSGVYSTARNWNPATFVDDFWCPQIVSSMADDPHVLAFYLGGSFDEWVESYRQPQWANQLDSFCDIIRNIHAPILAVCGSHQLVGYAYGGWGAVAHMAHLGQSPVDVLDEADGIFGAPSPRIGEVGSFTFVSEQPDLILNGLPDLMHFVEYHHDQVIGSALPSEVTSLLLPNGLQDAVQGASYIMFTVVIPGSPLQPFAHQPLIDSQERCRVQMLRYNVAPEGRLLYTTQFHPEVTFGGEPDNHGKALIVNFLNLAFSYWAGT